MLAHRYTIGAATLLLAAALAGCGASGPPTASDSGAPTTAASAPTVAPASTAAPQEENAVTTPTGLQYIEITPGSGEMPQPGDIVAVHYRGTLADGTEFDSSLNGEPIRFALGKGMVIPGWDEGIGMMRQGGKARLIIPPDLAYGAAGYPPVIPANATLTFEVELVEISAGAPAAPTNVEEAAFTTTPSGLKYHDFAVGDGALAEAGKTVSVHYTGWLPDGTKFDSSLDRGEPITFPLGAGRVIKGWDEGIAGMQVGGRRQLVIPPDLGYGPEGYPPVIPANATLIFEVELMDVQ